VLLRVIRGLRGSKDRYIRGVWCEAYPGRDLLALAMILYLYVYHMEPCDDAS